MDWMNTQIACKISEGVQTSKHISYTSEINLYNRRIRVMESDNLSLVQAFAANGLRATAFLTPEEIGSNINVLYETARLHIPLVLNVHASPLYGSETAVFTDYQHVHAVSKAGWFQLIARSPWEEMCLIIAAHKIAELSLIPGMVISDYVPTKSDLRLPPDADILSFLGSPDQKIKSPTPAQEIIFGVHRRQVPDWFSLANPGMLGARKDELGMSFEAASSQKYFYQHLPEIMEQVFLECNKVFGFAFEALHVKGKKSPYAMISIAGKPSKVYEDHPDTKKYQWYQINQLVPFPSDPLKEHLASKKGVSVFEHLSNAETRSSEVFQSIAACLKRKDVRLNVAQFDYSLDSSLLDHVIQKQSSKQDSKDVVLGIPFYKDSSSFPKQRILNDEINLKYPGIGAESVLGTNAEQQQPSLGKTQIPLAVRLYKDNGPAYSKLSRFYNNQAFFIQNELESELIADPFAAIPYMPATTGALFDQSKHQDHAPHFDLNSCTACGDCFVHCPHSAILPLVIGIDTLVQSAIEILNKKGVLIFGLTPMLKNLSKVAAKAFKNQEGEFVRDLLPNAFDSLLDQMAIEGDQRDKLSQEMLQILDVIGDLPVGITEDFFNNPNTIDKGKGELFSLILDTHSCTACGLCATICPEDSIEMVQNSEETTHENLFTLWEQLPDISSDTITRMYYQEGYNSLAAVMLSRNYAMAMLGGNADESDNPYKSLVHVANATAESIIQPRVIEQIKALDRLIDSIAAIIKESLSKALNDAHIAGITESLLESNGTTIDTKDVLNRLSDDSNVVPVDEATLDRRIKLIDALKALKWQLEEGPTGVGRSRFSMLIAGKDSMDWAKHYPYNHFTNPVFIHWKGSAPEQALGLFFGQLRHALDGVRLIRKAELEAQNIYAPAIHDQEIAALTWEKLSKEEKLMIPPVFMFAERADLSESGWSSLNMLLGRSYPIKVVLLDHMASPTDTPVAQMTQTMSGLFSTIALRSAYVYQGGLGHTEGLYKGLLEGISRSDAALFLLYATKLDKHEVSKSKWASLASLVLESRAFPELSYDPKANADFIKGGIDISGNDDVKSDWCTARIEQVGGSTLDYQITWADWAFTQEAWKEEFRVLEDGENKMSVADYLNLDQEQRANKIPVISRSYAHGLKHYALSPLLVNVTEAVLHNWHTLQELAGEKTEFPNKLRKEVEKEFQEKFNQDLETIRTAHAAELANSKAEYLEQMKSQIKQKLVELTRLART